VAQIIGNESVEKIHEKVAVAVIEFIQHEKDEHKDEDTDWQKILTRVEIAKFHENFTQRFLWTIFQLVHLITLREILYFTIFFRDLKH
jgi:hypothetical protein